MLALDVLEAIADVLAPAFDRAQERGEGEAADIGVVGARALARDALFQVRELAFQIAPHCFERRQTAPQVFHPEPLQAHQRIAALHDALPFFAHMDVGCAIAKPAALSLTGQSCNLWSRPGPKCPNPGSSVISRESARKAEWPPLLIGGASCLEGFKWR